MAHIVASASRPQAIAIADWNRDGLPDLVTADSAGEVQAIVMTADGGFQTTGLYGVGAPAAAVTAADFDGDGIPDMAVATSAGAVYVLHGNGDGTFVSPAAGKAAFRAGQAILAAVAADFDRDGKPDLAIADAGGELQIWKGNGDGTFAAASAGPASVNAGSHLLAADVNGDGYADLLFATAGGVNLLAGKGDGSFGKATTVWRAAVRGLAVADLAGNGHLSVLVSEGDGQLTVLGSRLGAFTRTASYEGVPGFVSTGDFDGDGQLDVAVTDAAAHRIRLYAGRGNGTLAAAVTVDAGMPVSAMTAGAGDGGSMLAFASEQAGAVGVIGPVATAAASRQSGTDGLQVITSRNAVVRPGTEGISPDSQVVTIIALSASPSSTVYGKSVTLNAAISPGSATGRVTFYDGVNLLGSATVSGGAASISTVLLNPGAHSLTARYAGDANSLPSVSSPVSHPVTASLGTGFPTYTGISLPAAAQPGFVTVSDFNRDGRQDAAVVNAGNNTVSIFLGNGNGTFGYPTTVVTSQTPYAAVAADFNGDGFQDLAVSAIDGIEMFRGNGSGQFTSAGIFVAGSSPAQLATGDFNLDGIPDLAVANSASTNVSVLLGKGDGTFQPASNLPTGNSSGSGTTAVAILDFNRDGKPDLAAIDSTDGLLYLYTGNGNGTFQGAVAVNVGGTPADIATGDFNGDGSPDLAIADSIDSQLLVLLGNGNGTFQPAAAYPTGSLPLSVAVSDFNGDGRQDVVVANSFDNTVSVFTGTGSGTFGVGATYPGVTYNPGGFLTQVATGEFNGDGAVDLAVANAGDILGTSGMAGQLGILLGGSCSFSTNPTSLAYDSRGGSASVTLFATNPSCAWTGTSSDSSWITLSSTGGVGTTGITVTISANGTGATRTGTVTLGGVVIPVTEGGTVQVFTDVPPTAYWFDAVNLLAQKGITSGCSATTYCPTSQITRAQMAVFIVRSVYGSDNFTYSTTPYFHDVANSTFGFQWIQKMYELGITTGCGSGNFCPNSNVTRDQMAVFIIRARYGAKTQFSYSGAPSFTDVPASDFAFSWIQRMKEDAITSGCSATLYCPSNPVTRGDMAVFVIRGAFNLLLPANTPVITSVSPATITHGASGTVVITGAYTNFVQGVTTINTTAGEFTVGSITVTSPTSLTAQITALGTAPLQPTSIYITTGTQEEVLPNGLVVN